MITVIQSARNMRNTAESATKNARSGVRRATTSQLVLGRQKRLRALCGASMGGESEMTNYEKLKQGGREH